VRVSNRTYPNLALDVRAHGYAGWRIPRLPVGTPDRKTALALFVRLALNAARSWMLFGLNNLPARILNIILQLLVVLATADRFRRPARAMVLCAAYRLGRLRKRAQFRDLATERLRRAGHQRKATLPQEADRLAGGQRGRVVPLADLRRQRGGMGQKRSRLRI